MKQNQKQIDTEIERLKKMAPRLPPSAFGDDNAAACRAQIRVLEEKLTETQVYDAFDNPSDGEELNQQEQHQLDAALEAGSWAAGEERISPADGWAPIIKRATGLNL